MPSYEGLMPVYGSDNAINDYTKTLGDADSYMYSVQHAKDLHLASLPKEEVVDEEIQINSFGMSINPPKEGNGIPEDIGNSPLTTPDVQLGEQKEPLMTQLFNSAPKPLQKMLTPFLVPFTNNKVLKGVTIGMGDAINGSLGVLRDINNAVIESNGGVGISQEDWMQLPEIIERGDSTTEALVGGLTQFMSIYGALGKVSSVNKMSSRGKKLFDDMWRGGLADAAFDPEEGNLATLINMLDEDKTVAGLPIGQMNGAFTQWLGTPVAEDAEAFERLEQRAKNLMEGAGLGLLANGLVAGIKGIKQIMIESDPDKYFAMLKKAGFDVDPRSFLFENTLGADNIQTPKLNELGMYSQLEKAMLNLTQDTNKPDDLLRYLTKNGVTNDELTNSGVMDLINQKKKTGESITKAEVGEIFDDMDVTQSYDVITREYGADSNNIDSMSDEEDLLAIYKDTHMFDDDEVASMNGKVLDHDEMYDDLVAQAEDISAEWISNINGEMSAGRSVNAMEDSTAIASNQLLDLEVALKKSDPAKYGDMSAREILQKVRNIDNDNVFSSDVDEAVMRIAESNYDQSPIFRWELNEGDFDYIITGSEDTGYQTKVYRSSNGIQLDENSATGLDVVYSANEAMVQVRNHNDNFGNAAMGDSGTKWHEYITEDSDINSYKETIITADSPSGEIFKGDQGLTHFPDDDQVFHIRTTNRGSNTLFIEEIQSDWSNAISKSGVKKGETFTDPLQLELIKAREAGDVENVTRIEKLIHDDNMAMPVTPLAKDKWMNVGLRKAIAMAIDSGQTRVEWSTAADQVKQWGKGDKGDNFEEMYINLYDKKLGGLAKKIANKYNSKSGQHYIEISPEMIAHHKSGKGQKLMATAPAIPAAQVANDKEDKS